MRPYLRYAILLALIFANLTCVVKTVYQPPVVYREFGRTMTVVEEPKPLPGPAGFLKYGTLLAEDEFGAKHRIAVYLWEGHKVGDKVLFYPTYTSQQMYHRAHAMVK